MVKRLIMVGLALAGFCLASPCLPLGAATRPAAAPTAPSEALVGELDTVIRQSVTVARAAQEHERTIGSLARDLADANRELATKQRALDEARTRAAALLAALERLAHTPPAAALLAPQLPVERLRSGMLMAAAVPALSTEARALIAEMQRLAALRTEAIAKQDTLTRDRQDLARNHERLDQLSAKREELRHQILHDAADGNIRAVKLGAVAADLPDLIARTDAEAELRDREARQRAAKVKGGPAGDPTHPKSLRGFDPHAALALPIAGPVVRRFGEASDAGVPSQGLILGALGNAEVVAPFDGRIDYVGPFRGYGVILIIGHGGGYHSVLAGMGRVDAKIGEWVLAGEPIGVLPEPAKPDEGVTIYFELRRDGRPIDPQLSLAERGERTAEHRVSE